MTKRPLIDYYKTLAVPPEADLIGIENAYVRLSDELVREAADDDGANRALARLNEAYTVLANPESRRLYDRVLFAKEYEELERRLRAVERRAAVARWTLVGALGLIVTAQAVTLAYLGWDSISGIVETVLGPLYPGSAG